MVLGEVVVASIVGWFLSNKCGKAILHKQQEMRHKQQQLLGLPYPTGSCDSQEDHQDVMGAEKQQKEGDAVAASVAAAVTSPQHHISEERQSLSMKDLSTSPPDQFDVEAPLMHKSIKVGGRKKEEWKLSGPVTLIDVDQDSLVNLSKPEAKEPEDKRDKAGRKVHDETNIKSIEKLKQDKGHFCSGPASPIAINSSKSIGKGSKKNESEDQKADPNKKEIKTRLETQPAGKLKHDKWGLTIPLTRIAVTREPIDKDSKQETDSKKREPSSRGKPSSSTLKPDKRTEETHRESLDDTNSKGSRGKQRSAKLKQDKWLLSGPTSPIAVKSEAFDKALKPKPNSQKATESSKNREKARIKPDLRPNNLTQDKWGLCGPVTRIAVAPEQFRLEQQQEPVDKKEVEDAHDEVLPKESRSKTKSGKIKQDKWRLSGPASPIAVARESFGTDPKRELDDKKEQPKKKTRGDSRIKKDAGKLKEDKWGLSFPVSPLAKSPKGFDAHDVQPDREPGADKEVGDNDPPMTNVPMVAGGEFDSRHDLPVMHQAPDGDNDEVSESDVLVLVKPPVGDDTLNLSLDEVSDSDMSWISLPDSDASSCENGPRPRRRVLRVPKSDNHKFFRRVRTAKPVYNKYKELSYVYQTRLVDALKRQEKLHQPPKSI